MLCEICSPTSILISKPLASSHIMTKCLSRICLLGMPMQLFDAGPMLYSRHDKRELLASKADILHMETLWRCPHLWMADWKAKFKSPIVCSPHGMLDPWIIKHPTPLQKAISPNPITHPQIPMPTLLHYIPSIDETSGGVGAYMQLLTRDLGKLCDLHVLTHQSTNERHLQGCTLHYIDNKWLPWDNCKKDFLCLLDEVKPDVVHVNCCWMPLSSMIVFWAKERGLRVVYTPHGMLMSRIVRRNYWTRKLPAIILYQRRAIQLSDTIHATAEGEKQDILSLGWNKNIHIIGNCINVDDITMKSSWKKRNVILFLGRVHFHKGIRYLIEAVAKLKDQIDGYVVKIAGPGDETYVNELKSLAQKLGVADQVQFIGSVFGKDKFDLYREADLFVLPTHSENFGIVVTEALACGTPVVTTKGAPWAELESHHCGWWTEIGADPTAEALKSFLSLSESDLELMGRNGRALVEERYSCQKIAQEFMTLYSSLSFSHTRE